MVLHRPVRSSSPEISVVVPTLPSREILSLDSLRKQKDVDYEVLIVEDSSLDICEARNLGIENAAADIIAITDDDTEPPHTWAQRIYQQLSTDDIELIEGPILNKDSTRRVYHGANLGVTRRAFQRVDGFDSQYAGWMDDTVFGWRIEDEFGRDAVKFDPQLQMRHPPPMKSQPDEAIERLARREFTDRYFSILRQPDSLKGKVFIAVASRSYVMAPRLWDKVL